MRKIAYSLAFFGLIMSGEVLAGSPYCSVVGASCSGVDDRVGQCKSSSNPAQNAGYSGYCFQNSCATGYISIPGGSVCPSSGNTAYGGSTCCKCGPTDCGGVCYDYNKSYCSNHGSGGTSSNDDKCNFVDGTCSGQAYNGSSGHCTCQSGKCNDGMEKQMFYKDNPHFSGSSFYCVPSSIGACPSEVATYSSCPSECTECLKCKANGATKYMCTHCKQGYILNSCGAGKASMCTPFDCGPGYYLEGSSCTGSCKECSAGYYCDGHDKKPCPAGAYSASARASACTSCPPQTTSVNTGSTQCSSCKTLFSVAHGQCIECDPTGCKNATCDDGYSWNSNSKKCEACSNIRLPGDIGTCEECENGICTFADCPEGYSWNGTSCISEETVQSCAPPFVKDESGKCCIEPVSTP